MIMNIDSIPMKRNLSTDNATLLSKAVLIVSDTHKIIPFNVCDLRIYSIKWVFTTKNFFNDLNRYK